MTHIVLAAQADLDRKFVPESVAVGDIERMILHERFGVLVICVNIFVSSAYDVKCVAPAAAPFARVSIATL